MASPQIVSSVRFCRSPFAVDTYLIPPNQKEKAIAFSFILFLLVALAFLLFSGFAVTVVTMVVTMIVIMPVIVVVTIAAFGGCSSRGRFVVSGVKAGPFEDHLGWGNDPLDGFFPAFGTGF